MSAQVKDQCKYCKRTRTLINGLYCRDCLHKCEFKGFPNTKHDDSYVFFIVLWLAYVMTAVILGYYWFGDYGHTLHIGEKPPVEKKVRKHEDYPVGLELGGSFGSKRDNIVLHCLVTRQGDDYLYTYRVKNEGDFERPINWTVLDIVLMGHMEPIPNWWKLQPNEEIVIRLISEEAPVWYMGRLHIAMKARGDDESWGDIFSGRRVHIPAGEFFYVNTCGQPGPLPPSYLKELK